MKKNILLASVMLLTCHAFAQLSGNVIDASTKEKIPGAAVAIANTFLVTSTDAEGKFSFPNLNANSVQVIISHIGFETKTVNAKVPDNNLEIALDAKTYIADEVVVTATRASDQSPTAFTTVNKKELDKNNLGQDMPYLLNNTPSVVVTSDAGAGVGYTGIRIRGSDATRVNVTINGIPINDAEENGMYWVDLPDFASSTENIQIQRGIGTSTNGSGAFGGSVNILSSAISREPFATLSESYGSFNTWKNTLNFGTGLLKNKLAFEGRLSKISSDGFVDRGASDLKSFYLAGGYYGKKSTLRAIIFSGKEKTYQSWNGVPEAKLKNDSAALVTHYNNNIGYLYNTPDDSINLFSSNNRTYNVFTYKNQTDNYRQDYYQLHYAFAATSHLTLNAALHYTKGKGYYEEYKYNQTLTDYHLNDVVIGDTTITSTNLIRQKWLDNDFYGFTFSFNYETDKLLFTLGGAGNQYKGRHFDQIIWAQYASNGGKDFVYDDNDATKNDFNVFAKAIYSVRSKLHLFADIQYRMVDYSFLGLDVNAENIQQDVKHNFFNPKAGVTYELNKKINFYASFALGNKEPIRGDYINSTSASRPRPEKMEDIECGARFSTDGFEMRLNAYHMNYKDQLIPTGEVNDVGAYTRMNVSKSYRQGVEFEFMKKISPSLSLAGNLTVSQNKIKSFSEFVDSYDADFNYIGQDEIKHTKTDIAFSPGLISSVTLSWLPVKNLSLDFVSKYVGKQYLDNTSNETRRLDAYFLQDALIQYHFSLPFCKDVALKFAVYNLFNEQYESNGYTYGYFYGGELVQENFYFPQAGTNWLGGVSLKF